jgi:hypothetical protein
MYRFLGRTLVSLSVLITLAVGSGRADSFQGRVVGISDGDTLTVLAAGNRQHCHSSRRHRRAREFAGMGLDVETVHK